MAFQFCIHQDEILQWHCNYSTCKKFNKKYNFHQDAVLQWHFNYTICKKKEKNNFSLLGPSTVFSSQWAHNFDFQKFVRHNLGSSLFPKIQREFKRVTDLKWHFNSATCKNIEKKEISNKIALGTDLKWHFNSA